MTTQHDTRPTVDLVPVEYDTHGRPRRYEVVHIEQPQQPPAVIDAQPIVSPLPPAPPRLMTITEGSHQDRARAFGIETLQLSLITGGLFVVASIALQGAILPIFTLGLIYFAGFAVTWLIAYLLHTLRSAEGVELYSVFRLWNFLDNEQRERHRRYGQPEKRLSTGDRVFALLMVGWLVLVFVFWLLAREGVIVQ